MMSKKRESRFDATPASLDVTSDPYLDLSEVHRFADELVILGQLLARWQLNEDFAQLTAVAVETKAA